MNQEINIIKEQIKILLENGFIFEVKKGEYKGLGIKDTLYIQMKGGLKNDN